VIDGENTDGVVVVVVDAVVEVVSVDVGVVSVDVELVSLGGGEVSVAVDVLSVVPVPASKCMAKAPEAITPAQSSAPKPRTMAARRSVLRPFMSPAPLLPQIRRMSAPP
jgi:hypothetical protein